VLIPRFSRKTFLIRVRQARKRQSFHPSQHRM
jgi:hypothetical protein